MLRASSLEEEEEEEQVSHSWKLQKAVEEPEWVQIRKTHSMGPGLLKEKLLRWQIPLLAYVIFPKAASTFKLIRTASLIRT